MLTKKTPSVQPKINPMAKLVTQAKERNLADSISENFEEKGVKFFSPNSSLNIDTDYLTLPADLTEIESKELGRYLNAFTQQKMYMRTLISWQSIFIEEKKREYYAVSTPIYSTLSKKDYTSESSKERFINNHSDVVDVFYELRNLEQGLNTLELNIASIEDAVFLLSREVSRRNADFNDENRNDNVSKIKR